MLQHGLNYYLLNGQALIKRHKYIYVFLKSAYNIKYFSQINQNAVKRKTILSLVFYENRI